MQELTGAEVVLKAMLKVSEESAVGKELRGGVMVEREDGVV